MTRKMTKPSFPYALASSTLGTVLVSMTAVWLATAAYAPLTAPAAQAPHSTGSSSHSSTACRRPRRRRLDLLSPIPLPRSPSLEPAFSGGLFFTAEAGYG